MPVMNTSAVRVVDPLLSTHVRGYKQAGLVGATLFPEVDVDVSGGKVTPMEFVQGRLIKLQDGLVWWQDEYVTIRNMSA